LTTEFSILNKYSAYKKFTNMVWALEEMIDFVFDEDMFRRL